MAIEGARYTIEQLKALRESPLVRKPDELPSIDEWIEGSQQSQQETGGRKPRNQSQRPEEPAPMGNFSSQRPSLLQTRHTSSRSAQQPDEIVLGPPKTSFASSRNANKLEEREQEQESPAANQRSRFFRDRETHKTGNSRDWRSSKQQQEDDDALTAEPRFTPRQPREGNGSGFGQRFDQRWSRDNNDRDRDRERERPSQRGGWRDKARNERQDAAEKEPEWMDEPLEKENKNQIRTQEDFEQWKERMKAASNGAPTETKQEAFAEEVATPVKTTPAHSKPQTPLVTDAPGFDKSIFGSWGESKRLESPVDTRAPKPPAGAKSKSSRFASMFAPKEESRAVVEEAASPAPLEANEDKAGFLRIMAGLRRGTSNSPVIEQDGRGPPIGPPPGFGTATSQDALAAMFDKAPAPASAQCPRPHSGFNSDSFLPPPPSQFSRPDSNVTPPDPASMRSGNAASHLPQQMQSIFLDQAPRNAPTPENFSQQHSRKPNSLNKDSEFLLNLIQAKNANRGVPQSRNQHEPEPFQLFLDQPPKTQTAAPKPQAPRPTESIEEQLFRGNQHPPNMDHGRPRAPPGFIEDPSIVLQQAQRSYPNGPPQPRRQSVAHQVPNAGPGAPQDFPPNFPYMAGGPPPPGPGDRLPPAPPGFNPNIRHPPGFANIPNIPNIFHQPNSQPPPQQGLGMQGPPPGFPPGMGLPPPGFVAQGPPPPGFFNNPNHTPGVPPGFAPPGMMMMTMPGGGIRTPDGTPGMRSPQEGPGMGMPPMLQGMGAAYGGRR